MASLIKLLAIVVVVSAFGALQFALPWLSDQSAADNHAAASTSTKTKLAFKLEYESETQTQSAQAVEDYSDVQQGSLFFVSEAEDKTLFQHTPLLDTQLSLSVTGMVARAKLTQQFVNHSDEWVNHLEDRRISGWQ